MGIAMQDQVLEIAKQMLTFGVLHSVIVYGILQSINNIRDKNPEDGITPTIPNWLKILLTYGLSFMWYPFFTGIEMWAAKLVMCIFVGVVSVAVYKSAVKSVLDLVPTVFTLLQNKILGKKD